MISHVFILFSLSILNAYFRFIPGDFAIQAIGDQLLGIFTFAIAAAGTSLIALYFGMRKYSVSATILSSILIVALISSHNPEFSVASIVYIPLALALIGILIVFWAIRDIEHKEML